MTNVDEKITKRCGKANPFTTPEGYFDSFTERMMGVIADNDKSAVIAPKKNIFPMSLYHMYLNCMLTKPGIKMFPEWKKSTSRQSSSSIAFSECA